jgi:hypothetical protein
MHPYEYTLAFRLRHQATDLADLYETLGEAPGFIPGRIWKAGDQRQTQAGRTLEGHYDKSYCYFELFSTAQKSEVESPAAAIERVVTLLQPYKSVLQQHVRSGGELELFLSVYVESNSSEGFSPDLMRQLADFEIELSIDIYPPDNATLRTEKQ